MKKNTIEMYNGKAYGVEVSKYGMEHGYLDYKALANIVGDCILNNTIRQETYDWEIVSGDYGKDVFQDYIISEEGFRILSELTDEVVFYNETFNLYLWGITHFGTSWDYVLTDVELK